MTQPLQGETTLTASITAAEAPESHLAATAPAPTTTPPAIFDAPPSGELPEWPPVGAYPGEPGHPVTGGAHPGHPVTGLPPVWPPFAADRSTSRPQPASPAAEPGDEPATAAEVLVGEPVWHQPPPAEPFHARHEKPGEWLTEPPAHLALEHSPPAEVQPGVQHDQPTEAIPLSMLPHPWEVPFDPHAGDPAVLRPPPKHKRPFWVAVALVLTLLIFGGGTLSAYLLLRNAENGKGAPDPATAVDRFMTAMYTRQDPRTAGDLVCREARDQGKLQARVDQIKGYANDYEAPAFRWNDPAVTGRTDDRATVGVQLTMTTEDEKVAQQQLTFTVIRKTSWLVCDVSG